jgi:hypothetical protein
MVTPTKCYKKYIVTFSTLTVTHIIIFLVQFILIRLYPCTHYSNYYDFMLWNLTPPARIYSACGTVWVHFLPLLLNPLINLLVRSAR